MATARRNGNHFSVSHFENKLASLKDTQESIQGLSTWCLNHKSDFHHIIRCWLKAVKRAKTDQCLTLFYLANDIIQHSKKKNLAEIVTAWEPALMEASPFVSKDEEKVLHRVRRIFKIWEEREVYTTTFIQELNSLLEKQAVPHRPVKAPAKAPLDFDATHLIEKIQQCQKLEEDTDLKQQTLNESQVKITEVEALRASVKERRKTENFLSEFDASVSRMEDFVRALQEENRERTALIGLLEQGDQFYEAQRGEFKVVCLAYKQFGSRVKGVKRKLHEITSNLSLPSNADAPSPSSNDSDLELPDAFANPSESTAARRPVQPSASGEMDLDSRITSFLAGGSQTLPMSFLSSPDNSTALAVAKSDAAPSVPQSSQEAFPFYPVVNGPFGDLTSLLVLPPPPPPPLPLLPPPPPVFQDVPRLDYPPVPQLAVVRDKETWQPNSGSGQSQAQGHHLLPSRIPSWSESEELACNDVEMIVDHQSASFFSTPDVDLRGNTRPIDHRNLISLTSGPGKYSPPASTSTTGDAPSIDEEEIASWLKDVRSQGSRESHSFDLNDQQAVSHVESFDRSQRDVPHVSKERQATDFLKSLTDPNLLHPPAYPNRLQPQPHGASLTGQDHPHHVPDAPKVPSLMATLLYPDRPPVPGFGSDNSTRTLNSFPSPRPHFPNQRGVGSVGALGRPATTFSPTIGRGLSPTRFNRPPYSGSRW